MRVTSLLAVLAALALSTALLLGVAIAEPRRLPVIWCAGPTPVVWRQRAGNYEVHLSAGYYWGSQIRLPDEWTAVPDDAVVSMVMLLWAGGWTCKVESK